MTSSEVQQFSDWAPWVRAVLESHSGTDYKNGSQLGAAQRACDDGKSDDSSGNLFNRYAGVGAAASCRRFNRHLERRVSPWRHKRHARIHAETNGKTLTGTYSGALGEAPMTGTVEGSNITIDFEVEGTAIRYVGKLDSTANKIEGTADYGGASGTFIAIRK